MSGRISLRDPLFRACVLLTVYAMALIGGALAFAMWLDRFDALYSWTTGVSLVALPAILIAHFTIFNEASPRGYSSFERYALTYSLIVITPTAIAVLCAVVLGMLAALAVANAQVQLLLEWFRSNGFVSRTFWVAMAAFATAVVGGLFFYFRLQQRFIYGATEALAGVVIAAHRTSLEPGAGLPSETGFYVAVLTAGVYLVVRGLDNMHQAYKAGDPLVNALRRKLDKVADQTAT